MNKIIPLAVRSIRPIYYVTWFESLIRRYLLESDLSICSLNCISLVTTSTSIVADELVQA